MKAPYDIAVLGGGCSGLSLGRDLAQRGYQGRAIIIEPRTAYEHDRTWCFWAPARHRLSGLVSKRWMQWRISSAQNVTTHRGARLHYQQVRSGDFYKASANIIANAPNIELRQGVQALSAHDDGRNVHVETSNGPFTARQVIDTRPRPEARDAARLWQIFSGGDIETCEACFDPDAAGLMEQMSSDRHGLKFTYILPITPERALVQTTRFTKNRRAPCSMDDEFKNDLSALTKGSGAVMRWERGLLPMGQSPIDSVGSPRFIPAGQAAGALRASSGYGFLRIQAWAQKTAHELVVYGYARPSRYGSIIERYMDTIFLEAFSQSPEASAKWFSRIADRLSGDEFASFMSQTPSPYIWMRVVSALPKTPFLKALFTEARSVAASREKSFS